MNERARLALEQIRYPSRFLFVAAEFKTEPSSLAGRQAAGTIPLTILASSLLLAVRQRAGRRLSSAAAGCMALMSALNEFRMSFVHDTIIRCRQCGRWSADPCTDYAMSKSNVHRWPLTRP